MDRTNPFSQDSGFSGDRMYPFLPLLGILITSPVPQDIEKMRSLLVLSKTVFFQQGIQPGPGQPGNPAGCFDMVF